eukprot:COSAG01_NODE_108_length_25947_cov_25.489593_1_plen_55_part_10
MHWRAVAAELRARRLSDLTACMGGWRGAAWRGGQAARREREREAAAAAEYEAALR